jgi:hypothetical protein
VEFYWFYYSDNEVKFMFSQITTNGLNPTLSRAIQNSQRPGSPMGRRRNPGAHICTNLCKPNSGFWRSTLCKALCPENAATQSSGGGELGENPYTGGSIYNNTGGRQYGQPRNPFTTQPTFWTPSYNPYQTPPFVPGNSGSSPGVRERIFNTSAAIASQIIASLGRRGTTQLTNSGDIRAISPYGSGGMTPEEQMVLMAQSQMRQQQQNRNDDPDTTAAGEGIDGIINWAKRNPMWVLGGLAAGILYFKQPKRFR